MSHLIRPSRRKHQFAIWLKTHKADLYPWGRVLTLALNGDPKQTCFHCTSIFTEKTEPCTFCETWEFHHTGKKPEWMEGH